MQSAYLWAATLGLPDTRTYTRSLRPNFGKHDGIFRIQLIAPSIGAPFPFNRAVECLASNLEIETYNLRIGKIIDGVVWKNTLAADSLLKAMRAVSTWKQAGRMYWGRWAQMQRIECAANGKRWNIPNLALNIPWAHLIVSRVKMRLWENASNAVHVFVDSVITPDTLKTGTNLGDWRLEKTYQNGVLIRKPGQYGAMDSPYLDRMAGVAINSPLRQTA